MIWKLGPDHLRREGADWNKRFRRRPGRTKRPIRRFLARSARSVSWVATEATACFG